MSKPVRRQTNTGTGTHWLRQTVRKAQALAKNTKWYGVKDGYILWAKRTGDQHTATLLDLPPQVRVVGNLGAISGLFFGSPRVGVGGSRDAFHPDFGADPAELTTSDLDNAQYPTGWQSVFIASSPSVYGIFMGGASPVSNDTTRLWFAGAADSLDLVLFYPLTRPLYARTEFIAKGDTGTAITIMEAYVTAATGGYAFSSRDVDDTFTFYPPSLPFLASDYDRQQTVAPVIIPVCRTEPGKSASEWGVDYGRVALFMARVAGLATENTTTALYLFQFPSDPVFEQPEWFSADNLGWTPAEVRGELVLRPDGVTVYYGTFFSFIYPTTPDDERDVFQMQTRFMLTVSPTGATTWTAISCNTAGTSGDPAIEDRRLNMDPSVFSWSEPPIAFYAANRTWSFWTTYDIGLNGLAYNGGGRAAVLDSSVSILRDDIEVARGNPPNSALVRDIGSVRTLMRLPTTRGYGSSYVACHLDEGDHFGVSFFVWDRTTGELKLGKWDTVDGFGFWEVDLTLMNDVAVDRLPSISVYNKCSVAETEGGPEVIGTPSFVVNSEWGGIARTYVIADGVAKYLGPFSGLQTVALGNKLQKGPLINLYR